MAKTKESISEDIKSVDLILKEAFGNYFLASITSIDGGLNNFHANVSVEDNKILIELMLRLFKSEPSIKYAAELAIELLNAIDNK